MHLPRRAEPRAGIWREPSLQSIRAVGIRPLVRASLDVQAPRPGLVVILGAGAHLPAPVPESLDACSAGGLEKLGLGVRLRRSSARHLSRLYLRQLPGPERGFGLREGVECPRRLECAARGADRLAGCFRYPMGRTAMPALPPHPRLLDAAREA